MAHEILKLWAIPVIKALWIRKISGLENLPKKGAFIVAANHASYLDPFLLSLAVLEGRNRKVRYVALKKYFYNPFIAPFMWWFRAIKPNGTAVEASVKLLKKGEVFGIFPEGARTRNGKIQRIEHTGTAVAAILSGKPIIPVSIKGAFQVWPRQKTFPKFRKIIEIKVGKPIHMRYKKVPSRKIMLKELDKIMKKIDSL